MSPVFHRFFTGFSDSYQSSLAEIDTGQLDPEAAFDALKQVGDTLFEALAGLMYRTEPQDAQSGEITGRASAESTEEPSAVLEDSADATDTPELNAFEEFYNRLSKSYDDQLLALGSLLQETKLPALSPPHGVQQIPGHLSEA